MNISKKMVTLALTSGIAITSLVGCGSEKGRTSILEGTLLHKTIVGTVDGDIAILRPESSSHMHKHYFDIVSGQYLTNVVGCNYREAYYVEKIEEIGSILSYLTEEEMLKASDGRLTEEDVIAIIYRIKESMKQEETELIMKK